MQGTVKMVNAERGFGFIRVSGGEDDIYFHISNVSSVEFDEQLIERGVTFDITRGPRGAKAINVRPAR